MTDRQVYQLRRVFRFARTDSATSTHTAVFR
jgi:hypothetical protein